MKTQRSQGKNKGKYQRMRCFLARPCNSPALYVESQGFSCHKSDLCDSYKPKLKKCQGLDWFGKKSLQLE